MGPCILTSVVIGSSGGVGEWSVEYDGAGVYGEGSDEVV